MSRPLATLLVCLEVDFLRFHSNHHLLRTQLTIPLLEAVPQSSFEKPFKIRDQEMKWYEGCGERVQAFRHVILFLLILSTASFSFSLRDRSLIKGREGGGTQWENGGSKTLCDFYSRQNKTCQAPPPPPPRRLLLMGGNFCGNFCACASVWLILC